MGYLKGDYASMKKKFEPLIGQEIIITEAVTKKGQKQVKQGKVENLYNTFFRVTLDDDQQINYNYSDIFTKDIKVQIFDGTSYSNLFVPKALPKKDTIPVLHIESFEELQKDGLDDLL